MLDIFNMFAKDKKQTINVNGVTYSGKNLIINSDGSVIIDGNKMTTISEKEINITMTGDAESIKTTNGDVNVLGSVTTVSTTNGDVRIAGDVKNNVYTANGDVEAVTINVTVKTVNGNIASK